MALVERSWLRTSAGAPVQARWLVTGAAGFIGSNLVEALLACDQEVVGLDNFSTGHQRNLDEVRRNVGEAAWRRMRFIEGDIRDSETCRNALQRVDYVLHQAALGSVPRSIARPLDSFASNVDGFVKLIDAAREAGVKRFVYASSSSVYGDSPELPKVEQRVGSPLSPYAATKAIDETVAAVFARQYGIVCIGLRYFNVFGPRQDPLGAYAAVIPRWANALLRSESVDINGDGQTSRDFCFVANAIQANLLACTHSESLTGHEVFNVAVGNQTTLLELYEKLRALLTLEDASISALQPRYRDFRAGDVRHSLADITKAARLLGYRPTHSLQQGLEQSIQWYVGDARRVDTPDSASVS